MICLVLAIEVRAGITESPEKCVSIYGEPKFTRKEDDGGVIHGYEPAFEGFGKCIVMALFREDKAVSLRYKNPARAAFTPDEFALIATLNELSLGKKLVKVGPSPDKTKEIWSAADNSAYMIVHTGQAIVEVMTQEEAVSIIKQMTPDSNRKRPVQAAEADDGSKFKTMKLAHGVTVDLPKSWWLPDKDMNEAVETAGQAAAENSGIEIMPDKHGCLVWAQSMPRTTYASIRLTRVTPPLGTPDEIAALTAAELKEMGDHAHQLLRNMRPANGLEVKDFTGCSLTTIGGQPAVGHRYRRTGQKGDVVVADYQISRLGDTIQVTLAYRESEAVLWKPVTERMIRSIKFSE
ncbi:MAG: hypothetical protein ACO1TE_16550 [Prosthecobacter sp.]